MNDLAQDAIDALGRDEIPPKDRMKVWAAVRQVRESPDLAQRYGAHEILLEAVGFKW